MGQHHFTASVGIFRDSCSSTPCISYTFDICLHVGRTNTFVNVLELSATLGQIFLYIWHTNHTYSNSNRFYANTKIVITLKVWSRIIHDKQVLPQAVKTFPCIIVITAPATSLPSDISVQSTHSTRLRPILILSSTKARDSKWLFPFRFDRHHPRCISLYLPISLLCSIHRDISPG